MSFDHEVSFACKILPLLKDSFRESIIFSPTSILSGLSLIYIGATDETEKEIGDFVGKEKSNTKENVIERWSKILKSEPNDESKVKISFGNGIFISSNVSLLAEFEEMLKNKLNGKIENVDFNNVDSVVNAINNFISKSTNNQITDTTTNEEVISSNNCICVNTLHFIAPWDNKFDKLEMKMFFGTPSREVQMMRKTVIPRIGWNLSEGKNWVCLGIPYDAFKAWFYIVLPNQHYSLIKLIENINVHSFEEFTKKGDFKGSKMFVTIPTIQQSSNHNLNEILENIGLKTLFNESCKVGQMSENLQKIDKILHTSFINIDENGSEASNTVSKEFEIPRTGGGYKFCADRPFLYFVVTCNDNKKVENNKILVTPNNLLYVGTYC
uniref:Serpin domain-containing protein n=1 Tax=Panagrolaimus sp. ES5 TaxID=591445 RepID=A0AC34GQY7_9BILA